MSYGTRDKLGKQLDRAIRLVGKEGILLVDNGAFSEFNKARNAGLDFAQAGLATMKEEYLDSYEAWAFEILKSCDQEFRRDPRCDRRHRGTERRADPKANLRKTLESWRGKAFTEAEDASGRYLRVRRWRLFVRF